MTRYSHTIDATRYQFDGLRVLLAKASPARAGDALAGIAAADARERVAAQIALSDVPLRAFLEQPVIPYEDDEVTRLIIDGHDAEACPTPSRGSATSSSVASAIAVRETVIWWGISLSLFFFPLPLGRGRHALSAAG